MVMTSDKLESSCVTRAGVLMKVRDVRRKCVVLVLRKSMTGLSNIYGTDDKSRVAMRARRSIYEDICDIPRNIAVACRRMEV